MAEDNAGPALTFGQRVAACKIIANDINKAGNGLSAQTWTTKSPKEGTGIAAYNEGEKVAILTVNGRGYLTMRSYIKTLDPSVLVKLESYGFTPGKFTEPVETYQGPGKRFDSSRLAK
jgi:hypothetical protein